MGCNQARTERALDTISLLCVCHAVARCHRSLLAGLILGEVDDGP